MATTQTRQRKDTDPRLSDDELKRALYLVKLCRYFDERMESLYRQGRLPGAIYSGRGQEGTHIGVVLPSGPRTRSSPRIATCPRRSRRAST